MRHSIGVVSRESEEIFRPQTDGHFCIRVMRANRVKNNEKRDEDVGSIGKLQVLMRERKREDKKNKQ